MTTGRFPTCTSRDPTPTDNFASTSSGTRMQFSYSMYRPLAHNFEEVVVLNY